MRVCNLDSDRQGGEGGKMPSQSAIDEAIRLKAIVPFRIVYISISPEGVEEVSASYTMRRPNGLARKGYKIFLCSQPKQSETLIPMPQ